MQWSSSKEKHAIDIQILNTKTQWRSRLSCVAHAARQCGSFCLPAQNSHFWAKTQLMLHAVSREHEQNTTMTNDIELIVWLDESTVTIITGSMGKAEWRLKLQWPACVLGSDALLLFPKREQRTYWCGCTSSRPLGRRIGELTRTADQ